MNDLDKIFKLVEAGYSKAEILQRDLPELDGMTPDELKAETGVTPVIAVDVLGSSADSYIGNVLVDGSASNKLKTADVSVTASNTADHTIDADANVTGGGAALGGSFGVSVLHDRSFAQLKKSIDADKEKGKVEVSSTAVTTEKVNVKASAAGGAGRPARAARRSQP